MIIPRRTVLVGSGAALALAAISPICAAEAANSLASVIAADGNSIKAIRVAGGDRISARLVDIDVSADRSPYALFKQFFTQNANQVAVYSAPPGHLTTALAAEPQLIYMAAGVMSLKAGVNRRDCVAGQIILVDAGAHHRQQAGTGGYTAIKVVLAN